MKRNVKLILLIAIVAAVAVGSYSIHHYHQAAPPFHNKQPAFSATHTVGSITADNASPVAAQTPLQGSTTSTEQPSAGAADSSTTGTPSTGRAAKAHTLPQGGSNSMQGLRASAQNLQNALGSILGL